MGQDGLKRRRDAQTCGEDEKKPSEDWGSGAALVSLSLLLPSPSSAFIYSFGDLFIFTDHSRR